MEPVRGDGGCLDGVPPTAVGVVAVGVAAGELAPTTAARAETDHEEHGGRRGDRRRAT